MSSIQYAFVKAALATLGVDDPENVRSVYMDREKVIVHRLALHDGKAYEVAPFQVAIAEETMRIDYSGKQTGNEPVSATEPETVRCEEF